jgi:host factor-I protein
MNKTQMNLQDNFLNQVRKEGIQVTIYLVSGVQLKGFVRGFDSFTVVLETPGKPSQLVYKHAMASVVPSRFVNTSTAREEREKAPAQAEAQPAQVAQPAEVPPVEAQPEEAQPAEVEPAEAQPVAAQTQE